MIHLKNYHLSLILTLISLMLLVACGKNKDDKVFFEAILELNDLDEDMDIFEFIDQMDRYGKEYEFIELEGVGHQIWDHPIKPYDKALEYIESIRE